MDTQKKIRRIIEFMNIPDFEKIISAKLLELEISMAPQIEHFRNLKSQFREMTINGLKLLENDSFIKREPPYYFELKRIEDKPSQWAPQWHLLEITPDPVNDTPETILNELAKSFCGSHSDPNKIQHKEILSVSFQRYFDIHFTKYSDNYVFGSMRESEKKLEFIPDQKENMMKLNLSYKNLKKEDSYGELFRYLETYPEIRERLLAYFYMVEKPAADNPIAKAY
ncbi:MAG: hypothetical protein GY757_36755 [bacterium]|nr:hypothetical protein [bacterium]